MRSRPGRPCRTGSRTPIARTAAFSQPNPRPRSGSLSKRCRRRARGHRRGPPVGRPPARGWRCTLIRSPRGVAGAASCEAHLELDLGPVDAFGDDPEGLEGVAGPKDGDTIQAVVHHACCHALGVLAAAERSALRAQGRMVVEGDHGDDPGLGELVDQANTVL
ncbi:hypothetical protein SPHINGOT1_510040 [Sphingomonas sp. T1]|nr:hypothetical protein SPHINGOT1_510040 [Sphingomonas sp. T1]